MTLQTVRSIASLLASYSLSNMQREILNGDDIRDLLVRMQSSNPDVRDKARKKLLNTIFEELHKN